VYQSVCRQPGLFDTPESPDWEQYTTKEKGAQGPSSNISKEILGSG
jgi:hypothetical protein